MYSLDVNFLKDRPDYRQPDVGAVGPKRQRQAGERSPILAGLAVGLLLPGLVGGLWFFLRQQNAQSEQEVANLDAQIQQQQIEKQKITKLNQETAAVDAETQALATVFNQIKPWSALLQDMRERVPPGVQITNIQQTQVQAAATSTPSPAASPSPNASPGAPNAGAASSPPPPTTQLEISGTARSFDDVGYFLLTLKRSSLFNADQTQLVSAELADNPARVEVAQNQNQAASTARYQLPKVVQYKISTSLSDIPASELLRELDRKGAVGLVTRIRTLDKIQDQGVTQP